MRSFTEENFKLQHAALLIIDMQHYFLDEDSHAWLPGAAAVVPRIKSLQSAIAAAGRPVWFTRHCNTPENAGMMGTWWRDTIECGQSRSEIVPEFSFDDEQVIIKSQYDAFYNSSLQERLEQNGIRQLIITGVMTHLCCETTARAAFTRGYEVVFVNNATASISSDHHEAALKNLSHGFAWTPACEEILELIGHA